MEKIVYQIQHQDGLSILVKQMTETVDELIEKLENFDIYKTEFLKIATEKRRLEFLNIRVALNSMLGKCVVIVYDEHGKPYIVGNEYNISISHSKNLLALAAHPEKSVGIDVEYYSDKVMRIYKRFLSETEQKEICGEKEAEKLMIAWSAKEALYKIIGSQAVDFASQLRIFPFTISETGEIEAEHTPAQKRYNLKYHTTDEFLFVYCLA